MSDVQILYQNTSKPTGETDSVRFHTSLVILEHSRDSEIPHIFVFWEKGQCTETSPRTKVRLRNPLLSLRQGQMHTLQSLDSLLQANFQ